MFSLPEYRFGRFYIFIEATFVYTRTKHYFPLSRIGATGIATIVASSYVRAAVLSVASVTGCQSAASVSASTSVFANLQPATGDIDLGNQYGLAFSAFFSTSTPPSLGQQVSVPLRINLGSSTGLVFTFTSFNLYYPSSWLSMQSITYLLPAA